MTEKSETQEVLEVIRDALNYADLSDARTRKFMAEFVVKNANRVSKLRQNRKRQDV